MLYFLIYSSLHLIFQSSEKKNLFTLHIESRNHDTSSSSSTKNHRRFFVIVRKLFFFSFFLNVRESPLYINMQISLRMQRDSCRIRQVERRSIDRCRDTFRRRFAGHTGDGRRFRVAQQHARRQGLHQGIDLHHPRRHGLVLFDHIPFAGRTVSSELHIVENSAGIQFFAHFRRSFDENKSNRSHPRRK